jgi:nitroreductase
MDLLEIIKSRRAVFPAQYIEKVILREDIELLLEAANWAPSHKKTEPWRFKVIQGEVLEQLGEYLASTYVRLTPEEKYSAFKEDKLRKNPTKASAIIAICMQRDPKERVPEWEEIAATAMAVQNLWLMAHSLEIGGYWSSPTLKDHMKEFLMLGEGEKCLGFFYLGYESEPQIQTAKRGPISEKISWM